MNIKDVVLTDHAKKLMEDVVLDSSRFIHKKTGHLVHFENFEIIKQQSGDVVGVRYWYNTQDGDGPSVHASRPLSEWNDGFVPFDPIILNKVLENGGK